MCQRKLQYTKIPGTYDPELDMMDLIETLITDEIREKGPRQVFVLADTWEGPQTFRLPVVTEPLIDRTIEWLHELDIVRIIKAGVLPPNANISQELEDGAEEKENSF